MQEEEDIGGDCAGVFAALMWGGRRSEQYDVCNRHLVVESLPSEVASCPLLPLHCVSVS